MRTVTSAVEKIITQSPFLRELISLEIVNLSELARQLKISVQEETQKKVNSGSIMVALKRLAEKSKRSRQLKPNIFNVAPELTVKSNLFEITVKNSLMLIDKQKKLLIYATKQQSHFVNFTYGLTETTTVASNQIYDTAKKIYRGEKIVSEVKNISTLSLKFPPEIADAPFTYYTILRTLAWSGISIVELISTYSELIIVLDQDDIDAAFSLIRKLFINTGKK